MPVFEVELSCTAKLWKSFEVEAESKEDAVVKAIQAGEETIRMAWSLGGNDEVPEDGDISFEGVTEVPA